MNQILRVFEYGSFLQTHGLVSAQAVNRPLRYNCQNDRFDSDDLKKEMKKVAEVRIIYRRPKKLDKVALYCHHIMKNYLTSQLPFN